MRNICLLVLFCCSCSAAMLYNCDVVEDNPDNYTIVSSFLFNDGFASVDVVPIFDMSLGMYTGLSLKEPGYVNCSLTGVASQYCDNTTMGIYTFENKVIEEYPITGANFSMEVTIYISRKTSFQSAMSIPKKCEVKIQYVEFECSELGLYINRVKEMRL